MKRIIHLVMAIAGSFSVNAQAPPAYPSAPATPSNVSQAEYFFNTDPGFGNGTAITLSAAVNIPSLVASINTSSLSTGIQRLYVRTRSASGNWSLTESKLVAVIPTYPSAPASPTSISKAEYFIDTDPGFGLGTNIPLTASANIPSLIASINTAALTEGIHRLYLRTRNNSGRWSITSSSLFVVAANYPDAPPTLSDVSKAEYFIDTDPGFGLGTNIPLTGAITIPSLLASINTASVSAGIHRLYVRTRASNGRWSLSSNTLFVAVPSYPSAPATISQVVKAEYYIDSDPGFGLATDIPLTAATDISALVSSINTSLISPGIHRLFVRTKNANEVWSITSNVIFSVSPDYPYPAAPAPVQQLARIEYFIDSDPGFGSGTSLPFTASTDINGLSASVSTTGLSSGIHRLYVRSRGNEGKWSLTESKLFAVAPQYPAAPAAIGTISKAEYFIDTDPGFGNGTNISLTAASNIPALVSSINTASLSAGIHRLYVRSRNAAGRWSLTSSSLFATISNYPTAPSAPGNIVRVEYFVDADPGFGNGVSVTITPAVNLSNVAFSINTSALAPGTHHLYVRSLDDWSLTSHKAFTVIGYPLPVTLEDFEAYKELSNVRLKWWCSNEVNLSHYEIERSKNGIEFEKIGSVLAKGLSTKTEYDWLDATPFNGLNYYRIKSVDLNGDVTYSFVKTVLFEEMGQNVTVYPNPSSNYLQIDFPFQSNTALAVQVYDVQGKMVLSSNEYQQGDRLDISTLASGTYLLQCSDGRNNVHATFTKL